MAGVRCFQVYGIQMWIPSGDHEPPHFHARKRGHWSARVFFLEEAGQMIRDVRPGNAKIGGGDRKAIVRGVEEHRDKLLEEWERCQAS